MTTEPVPWAQRQTESGAAYRAFLIFRDLGPARSLDQAGLVISPPEVEGTQMGRKRGATGRIREWARRWGWAERARAWDEHQQALHQQTLREATKKRAERWARRRDRQFEVEYRIGRRLMTKADRLARLPVVALDRDEQGKVKRVEALPPHTLRAAAAIAGAGAALVRGAIDAALRAETAERAGPIRHVFDQATYDRAEKELAEWRAKQMERLREMLKGPPGSDQDEDSRPAPIRNDNRGPW